MPELPEVEVTRLSFASAIEGSRVLDVRLGKPLRWPLGVEAGRLVGRRVGAVTRRGKYLWLPLRAEGDAIDLQDPTQPLPPDGGLLMHLGMSGSLAFREQPPSAGPHDHFELVTDRGVLRLTDPRRFGAVVWSEGLDVAPAAKLLAGMGLEPFDEAFNGAHLHRGFGGRRVAIKQAILAGDVVVGAGNIYACEALFMAGIDPRLAAGKISRPRAQRLAQALTQVLGEALEAGGSTLRDFKDAHGVAGSFQMQARVYGREKEPCRVCGSPIRRIVQGQRSTFFCPTCQKR
ncbi:bifunctional DNA-formamidopyrimidine glycosylase/DNA-(apurinic or apyrimidinic site) lyase [Roseateles sp. SL47]|uniref:bifunctional DNA-formamidopyrimidine glycosylase/DNA-(apurinic or apyrimidinic site) lyase n=1 Tax=Roseateles sp. SL47 TaxID=2995138 RepID=UPI002270215D|nr:bifunctional DNA-formamidopyrimidine glycosylase/DNA-(apurinic or apyrimidinic site) lyase [Roseateles sp. SL47]WAC73115.1 bifunctional DNA-formamidopyrimidine glycosylase/DNA-(apurinic or apyrimidinic site) lyase [Roseateles sp. SL47]